MTFISLMIAGEFFTSIALLLEDSNALLNMTVLSITSAVGQLFIFYTIKELGAVSLTIIMTTRQLFSLFLSCLMFSHPLSWGSFFSAAFVFIVVFQKIYRKGSD
jgi:adenosine 3'-phospho 5'-phosphosulfate transporter B2